MSQAFRSWSNSHRFTLNNVPSGTGSHQIHSMQPTSSVSYENVRFITVFTTTHHLSRSWPTSIQSKPHYTSYFLKITFNIILPSMSMSSKLLFPSGFPTKTLYTLLLSPMRAICPAHLNFLDFISQAIFVVEYVWCTYSTCYLLQSPVICSLLGPNIFLIALF